MSCDAQRLPSQTMAQRISEVKTAIQQIDAMIASRKVGVKVGPQGAVTFTGITQSDRKGITDACVYRMLQTKGSAVTRMAIRRAEQLAGRTVNRSALTAGVHSHDGGQSWSSH